MSAAGPRCVILAAGESRRLGEPKALARLGPSSALEHLARAAACPVPTVVVTGAHHDQIVSALSDAGAAREAQALTVARNERWAEGRTGSVAVAVRTCPDEDLLIAPVDVPLVPAEVFRDLRAEWLRQGAPPKGWLAPGTRGAEADDKRSVGTGSLGTGSELRPGHPIVIGRDLLARLATLDAERPLRELRSGASPLWMLETDAAAVHDDLDTPQDLDRLRSRFRP